MRLEGHFEKNFCNSSFTCYYYELETWQHCSPFSGSELYRCRFVREGGGVPFVEEGVAVSLSCPRGFQFAPREGQQSVGRLF